MNDHEHIRGAIWSILGLIGWVWGWFIGHIQTIDAVLQFVVLALSAVSISIGIRKFLRTYPERET